MSSKTNRFYVYVHKDEAGRIFYVGKGTEQRAWSEDRDANWHRYVKERSNGNYTVEIVQDGLYENNALMLENELMSENSDTLVNLVNWSRRSNYEVIDLYHKKRDQYRRLINDAKLITSTDPEGALALALAKEALTLVHECAALMLNFETGLIAEMTNHRRVGDAHVIARIVLCLKKLKDDAQLVQMVDEYFELYPDDTCHSQGKAALKARDIAAARLGKRPVMQEFDTDREWRLRD